MTRYANLRAELREHPRRWLVTGAAGFIGSALCEELLKLDQTVVGLDNFVTGHRHNIDDVLAQNPSNKDRFTFVEGDIGDPASCAKATAGAD